MFELLQRVAKRVFGALPGEMAEKNQSIHDANE